MALHPHDYTYITDLVRQRSAIALGPDKGYLVESRLHPLARQCGLETVTALITRLRSSPDDSLRTAVVEAMTTNETSWYRDLHPFRVFADHVVPDVARRHREDRTLTVWSAACSTGQEPYTIAMMLADHPALAGWNYEILASDLSKEVLVRARRARYTQLEVNRGLPASLLVKHFSHIGAEWELRPQLRNQVLFRQINLAEALPTMPVVDVVFLRNVLIYFDTETKRQVLQRIRQVMQPGGYLFLGAAETTLGLDDSFTRVQHGQVMIYQVGGEPSYGSGFAKSRR